MLASYRTLCRFVRDERGAEIVEYALVTGMMGLIAIGTIRAVGVKVLGYWTSLDQSLGL